MAATSRGKTRPITVALQGGGAHGAFTWGVLDALLADERIEIEGLSGSSAGAINAVVVADGIMADGREGAREALRRFWRAVSQAAAASPLQRSPIDVYLGNWSLDNSPGYLFLDLLSRVASPLRSQSAQPQPPQGSARADRRLRAGAIVRPYEDLRGCHQRRDWAGAGV